MPYKVPAQVSERETAHRWPDGRWDNAAWEDCGWCALVMWLRARGYDIPSTHAEAEALRAASGEDVISGSNFGDLRQGVKSRYPAIWAEVGPMASTVGLNAIWAALKPGTGAICNGSMGAFPSGHHWRRWDDQFAGGHSVFVARLDNQDRVWWMNPQAPNSFQGEWMSKSDLFTYMGAWSSIIGDLAEEQGGDMTVPVSEYVVGTATVQPPPDDAAAGRKANIRSQPVLGAATLLRAVKNEAWTGVVGWVDGDLDSGSRKWLLHIAKDGSAEYTHESNAIVIPAGSVEIPPSEDSCKPFSDAAYAEGYSKGTEAGIDTGYTAATTGASTEIVIKFGPKP